MFRDDPKHVSKTLSFTLPLPISVNNMYINLRNGKRTLSSQTKNYIRDSRALINQATEEQKWLKRSRDTWLYVDLVFFMPDRIVRDSHNMLKLLLDVMEGIVYDNDYFIMPRIMSVEYDKENPRVDVTTSVQTKPERRKALQSVGVVL